jgi:hypothetical protein
MDTLVAYMLEPRSPLQGDLCDAMLSTALTFSPPLGPLPASPQPDDKDRIMDQYTFFNHPQMLEFISTLDDHTRNNVNAALEMLHKRLPAFPCSFRIWDTLPGHHLSVCGTRKDCAVSKESFLHVYFKRVTGTGWKEGSAAAQKTKKFSSQCTTRAQIRSDLRLVLVCG